MKSVQRLALAISIALILPPAAQADLTIDVGDYLLQPNQSNQLVKIYINAVGGEQLQGIEIRAQLGDGGPLVGGADITPSISGYIIGPGTIFETNNTGTNDASAYPSHLDLGTTTASGFVTLAPGNNLFAGLLFDTTGFTTGTWSLHLIETVTGDTNTAGGPDLIIHNGSINIGVPEPSSLILAALGFVGLGIFLLRRLR